MKPVVSALAAVLLALTTAVVTAAPASSGRACSEGSASTAPDARIKVEGGTLGGKNVYPQFEVHADVAVGATATFIAKWKNLTDTTRTVRVVAETGFSAEWRVRYFLDGVNVTELVETEPLLFRDTGPGRSTPALEIVMKNKSDASGGEGTDQWLRAKFNGGTQQQCDWVGSFSHPA